MPRTLTLTLTLAAALVLGACQSHMAHHADRGFSAADADAVDQIAADWETAFNAKNWDGIRTLITDDVLNHQADMPMMAGADTYIQFFSSDQQADSLDIVTEEVSGSGKLAYMRGSYTGQLNVPDADPVSFVGKWLVVAVKGDDDVWRLSHHTASTDAPLSAP